MASHAFTHEQRFSRPVAEVFAFFADARNLAKLTPPSFRFETIGEAPAPLRAGAVLEHRIRVLGVPVRWCSKIEALEPGASFVDVQLRGPYRRWRHTHRFEPRDGGTRMRDEIEYEMPFGPAGELARLMFADRQLRDLFAFRHDVAARLLK